MSTQCTATNRNGAACNQKSDRQTSIGCDHACLGCSLLPFYVQACTLRTKTLYDKENKQKSIGVQVCLYMCCAAYNQGNAASMHFVTRITTNRLQPDPRMPVRTSSAVQPRQCKNACAHIERSSASAMQEC
eukprot:scaffold176802_cov23-Tisochrysis_lutea.AAC.1